MELEIALVNKDGIMNLKFCTTEQKVVVLDGNESVLQCIGM